MACPSGPQNWDNACCPGSSVLFAGLTGQVEMGVWGGGWGRLSQSRTPIVLVFQTSQFSRKRRVLVVFPLSQLPKENQGNYLLSYFFYFSQFCRELGQHLLSHFLDTCSENTAFSRIWDERNNWDSLPCSKTLVHTYNCRDCMKSAARPRTWKSPGYNQICFLVPNCPQSCQTQCNWATRINTCVSLLITFPILLLSSHRCQFWTGLRWFASLDRMIRNVSSVAFDQQNLQRQNE